MRQALGPSLTNWRAAISSPCGAPPSITRTVSCAQVVCTAGGVAEVVDGGVVSGVDDSAGVVDVFGVDTGAGADEVGGGDETAVVLGAGTEICVMGTGRGDPDDVQPVSPMRPAIARKCHVQRGALPRLTSRSASRSSTAGWRPSAGCPT